jgi:K+-transporting ATPase ATPase C chain
MRRQLVPALRMLVAMTVLLGLAYPLAMTGVAQVLFGDKADGSLVEVDGEPVGSSLIGQSFAAPENFHTRPSAAGVLASGSLTEEGEPADPDDLSVLASSASNQGPTNPDLLTAVEERAAAYREVNGLADDIEIPIDAVTASGSGLDPHISVANARLQAPRVAEERGLDVDAVLALVDEHREGPSLGFLGTEGVNVLELNLALNELG